MSLTILTTAIYGKAAGTAFETAINGRLFEEVIPDNTEYPCCVYSIVSDTPEYPGGHTLEDITIQFSIYSSSGSASEVKDILTKLRTVYDDCSLTLSDESLVYFIREGFNSMIETIETPEGNITLRHYAQDYNIMTSN